MDDPVLPGLPAPKRGKVRDVYEMPGERLLLVATDRISAFDAVLPTPIPDKGRVLTALSLFWFGRLKQVPNHVLTCDVAAMDLPDAVTPKWRAWLSGRTMLVKKAQPLPVECVARGYLAGSGWREYERTGAIAGLRLPAGLREAERLPEPLFTPATKAESGHDENITFAQLAGVVGDDRAAELRELTLSIYNDAAEYARTRGILLADTKFEFGLVDGQLVWIDEAVTPDSSRFWPADGWEPGITPPSFDKQYVRDWLDTVAKWNHEPPAPALSPDVVRATQARYIEAYKRLSGNTFTASPVPG